MDVVIVGAGPAGLSAALILARACRRVLLCDAGTPRNAPAAGVHAARYTSPHLTDITERFMVGDRAVDMPVLERPNSTQRIQSIYK